MDNVISILYNILDFSKFNLLNELENSNFIEINELIVEKKVQKNLIIKILENFINCENYLYVENFRKPKKIFVYEINFYIIISFLISINFSSAFFLIEKGKV